MEFYPSENPFLDKEEEIRMKKHHLDFWDQQGKFQSVTFHLADSLPQKTIQEIKGIEQSFQKLYPCPWNHETIKRYKSLIGKKLESMLDNGYGSCILKYEHVRAIVEEALMFYNEKFYLLEAYVIMPNHLHLLLRIIDDHKIEEVIGNLKRYTARKINQLLDKKGEFWYGDSYYRLIRNIEHFKNFKAYIIRNPEQLKPGEFSLKVF